MVKKPSTPAAAATAKGVLLCVDVKSFRTADEPKVRLRKTMIYTHALRLGASAKRSLSTLSALKKIRRHKPDG